MNLHATVLARTLARSLVIALAVSSAVASAQAAPALDDPNTVVTVMQFSARNAAARAQLQERMGAIRDYIRKQPGYIENALMENRKPGSKPDFACCASVAAAGPMARRAASSHWMKLVRFMKSSTDSPLAKRARRPVGSTWFGPAT